MNALTNKLLNGVFDIALVTVVNETPGKISYQTTVALKFAQAWSFGTCRECGGCRQSCRVIRHL